MKKIVFLFLIIAAVVLVYSWVSRNFGGFLFAWRDSSTPITDFFDEIPGPGQSFPDGTKEGENTTGFPLKLPPGFSIRLFARDLGGPRVMTWDPQGRLLVSIPARGTVTALADTDNDGQSDSSTTVIANLNRPHGIAFREGRLYVAETDAVVAFDYDTNTAKAGNRTEIVELNAGGNHFSRTIGFGPDDKLYISAGSTCNVCVEKDWRRALIMIANPDGSDLREYATGLRNSVFFTWSFVDGRMWATDMGRDLIGDNIPPEEINIIQDGKFYGWPYCYGKNVHDTSFDTSAGARAKCQNAEPSYIDMQAHSAPLGLAFIPEEGWPEEYWYNLLVSFHGSWNRTEPTGYKVVRIKLDETGKYLGIEDFITGWQAESDALGRPVDILVQPGGIMYISDDKAGVIYRVTAPQQ